MFLKFLAFVKGPLILLCRIISVECPTTLNFPLLTSNQNKGKQPISMKRGSKFVGHSTEITRQSKIKRPLTAEPLPLPFHLVTHSAHLKIFLNKSSVWHFWVSLRFLSICLVYCLNWSRVLYFDYLCKFTGSIGLKVKGFSVWFIKGVIDNIYVNKNTKR